MASPVDTDYAEHVVHYGRGGANLGEVENRELPWLGFMAQFAKPPRGEETLKQFLAMTEKEQRLLKNRRGYFFGGHSLDGHRRKTSIKERSFVNLDLEGDYFTPEMFESLCSEDSPLSKFEYFVQTSRKHTPRKPRTRVVVLPTEPIPADLYTPVARILAAQFDPTLRSVDSSCYRVAQMIFAPTLCADSEFVFHHNPGQAVDCAALVNQWEADTGNDSNDWSILPRSSLEKPPRKSDAKMQDPTTKRGIIGAFNRAYGVEEAIAEFELPYTRADSHGGEVRYHFDNGSGDDGMVVYDNLFAYSHHTTDPVSGRLLNAFDLVRIHKFEHLDEGHENESPTSMPSFLAMKELLKGNENVEAERDPTEGAIDRDDAFDDLGEAEEEPASEPAKEMDVEAELAAELGVYGDDDESANPEGLKSGDVELVRGSTIPLKEIEWVWEQRLARGKLTLIGGEPGMGKSQITLATAAAVSAGGEWPDGGHAPKGSVIVLSSEDAADDTILPRFIAAGGDVNRILFVKSVLDKKGKKRGFSLQRDLEALTKARKRLGDEEVPLVIIDPITAYMGEGLDSHRTSDVRAVLERVNDWSAATRAAVFAITHPPKAQQNRAVNNFTGSLAFAAAARFAYVTAEDENEQRFFLPVKWNIGPRPMGLAYKIEGKDIGDGVSIPPINAGHIVWGNETNMSADDFINAEKGDALRDAISFLRNELGFGRRKADDIKTKAQEQGISTRTLARAKVDLGVIPVKEGFGKTGVWWWSLPGVEDPEDRSGEELI